jgi:hypothetical protein
MSKPDPEDRDPEHINDAAVARMLESIIGPAIPDFMECGSGKELREAILKSLKKAREKQKPKPA